MADHSSLSVTDNYITLLETKLEGRLQDQAKAFDPAFTAATNIPVDTMRFTSASGKWERWNGVSWVDPVGTFLFPNISTAQLTVSSGVRFSDNSLQTTAAPALDGTGATGTWNIDISGAAARTSFGNGDISTNIANGRSSLSSNTTGYNNAAMGAYSLTNNTTGYNNTAMGAYSLANNTTGLNNTAIGFRCLSANTTGYYNIAVGSYSLDVNTTGHSNIGCGIFTLYQNTAGYDNISVGNFSLYSNTTGYQNTTIGNRSLFYNEGIQSTAIGFEAMYGNTTGGANTAIGFKALYNNSAGYNNTAIGASAMFATIGEVNCTAIGANAEVTGSNQVQLGNSGTTTYVYGTVQNRSDLRDKADIQDTKLGLNFINALRAVDYRWDMREDYRPARPELPTEATDEQRQQYDLDIKKWSEDAKLSNIKRDGSKKRKRVHHGLIAQEVKEVIDTLGLDFGGFQDHKLSGGDDVLSIGYDELIAPLIKSVQELSAQNKTLSERLDKLEKAINVQTIK